ncbi:MAG: site-2 protease family protein [Gemmatimonadota bacterium]|nr:site-2 protease family protein [Gemmatimonadota bacterium]
MDALVLIVVLLFSIVVHEVAHAWQARREGDDLAERLGRITLNPIPHLDPFGSVLVPFLLYVSGTGILFGWAKPVPVDPSRYRDPVWGDVRVSMAGIVSNLGLVVLATLGAVALLVAEGWVGPLGTVGDVWLRAMEYGILINLLLAFFNLLPIPPLDGSHVVFHMLPEGLRYRYRELGRYGLLILIGLLFLIPGLFRIVLWPVFFFRGLADSFIRLWI